MTRSAVCAIKRWVPSTRILGLGGPLHAPSPTSTRHGSTYYLICTQNLVRKSDLMYHPWGKLKPAGESRIYITIQH